MNNIKKFKQRNALIIVLFFLGILSTIFSIWHVQQSEDNREKYSSDQKEVTTSDLDFLLSYKSPYMGDASNLSGLFHSLPLQDSIKGFQVYSDKLTAQINFNDAQLMVGKINMEGKQYAVEGTQDALNAVYLNDLNKSLVYNSIAAFSLIGNLEKITYKFTDITYTVSRKDIIDLFGDLDFLLNKETWNKTVRDPFLDIEYVSKLSKKLLKIS
jgi:hypothetical protein